MKRTWKQIGSLVLAFCMVFTMLPAVAFAEGATVDIGGKEISAIKSAIEGALGSNNTVTVTGSKTGVVETLNLTIPVDKTVVWAAKYEGSTGASFDLIKLSNTGTFTVSSGGDIYQVADEAIYSFGCEIIVSGTGSVRSITSYAIHASGDVTVSDDAIVRSANSMAIYTTGANAAVLVNGGTVEAGAVPSAISVPYGNVTVESGTVKNTGAGNAIASQSGDVRVSGGVVRATSGYAIYTTGTTTVSGGVVFAYGSLKGDVIGSLEPEIAGEGLVIAWNNLAGTTTYEAGEPDDIYVAYDTDETTVVWAKQGGESGIAYTNGSNSGFLAIPGVTVTEAPGGTAPSSTGGSNPVPGTYLAGQHLDFTMTFDMPVTVGGTPRFALTIGTQTRYADYFSGSGTHTLVFRYTVQPGDLDTDGIASTILLDLNGGTIRSAGGVDAGLIAIPPSFPGVLVNGVAPTAIEVTGFETIPDEQVGKEGSTICANAEEVKTLLQSNHPFALAMHSGNQTVSFPITGWEDIDGYNPNKAGSYTFTVTPVMPLGFANSAGHKVTVEVVVASADTPTITITKHPQNVTVTQGKINQSLTAEAVASNGKLVSCQWFRVIGGIGSDNGEIIPGATSTTFTIPTNLTAGTYRYVCIFNTDGTDHRDSNMAIVTVNPPSSGGDGGGGSGVVAPAPAAPNAPTQGSVNVTGRVDGSGTVTATVTNQAVTEAIGRALTQARQNGTEQNGIALVLHVSTGNQTANHLAIALPKEVQDTLIVSGVAHITFGVSGSNSSNIAIAMDLAALRELNRQAGGNVTLTATRIDNSTLTGGAGAAIGNRPAFELRASYGSGGQVQSFGAGSVSVSIPYALGTGENAERIQAVYVDADGDVQWLGSSVYDSVNGVLRFHTNHFSTYGVGYKQDAPSFIDIDAHWAKEDIAFVANRGLLSGTSATTFSPNTAMTRGMFVTALGRLANADGSGDEKSSFTDVRPDAYYMGYVAWANKANIVKGIGDGRFAPDQSITREQMAVMMQNYGKAMGFTLPSVHGENTFADGANISAYAKDAVKQMQMAGVISGKDGNLFDPQGTATRAEVSAVLRRFIELATSGDTTQGKTV